jgi:hypothetical protein
MKVDAVLDLSAAEELSQLIAAGGGTMSLAAGDNINLSLPGDLSNLLPRLKEHKPELVALLRRRGCWIAHFPCCPKCGAYCLYRKGNVGRYECQRCGLQGIEERAARVASFLKDFKAPQRAM